jgi:hypothetical protein
MSTENLEDSYLRKQAWDYFCVHAAQRLTTFKYYIVISSVITTGMFASFQRGYQITGTGLFLGFVLVMFSFTFSKLDKRNRELIDVAESALKVFESATKLESAVGGPHPAKVFSREEYLTADKRANLRFHTLRRHFTYGDCFRIVFLLFGLSGFGGMALGTIALIWGR